MEWAEKGAEIQNRQLQNLWSSLCQSRQVPEKFFRGARDVSLALTLQSNEVPGVLLSQTIKPREM